MGHDRTAVVTGGGRGIGRGIVEALAAVGFRVAVNYRSDAESAEAAVAAALDFGAPEAFAIRADVADTDDGEALVDVAVERFGRLDVWVNNAGIAPERRVDLLEATPESFDRVLATNLRGPYFLTARVARAMIEMMARGVVEAPQIHFVTSVSASFATPARGEYCVSKAGLSMAAKLFAARLAEEGIAVFEIRPGIVATDMTEPVKAAYDQRLAEGLAPLRRWGTPADVGRVVATIATGGLPYATGNIVHVDGGMHLERL